MWWRRQDTCFSHQQGLYAPRRCEQHFHWRSPLSPFSPSGRYMKPGRSSMCPLSGSRSTESTQRYQVGRSKCIHQTWSHYSSRSDLWILARPLSYPLFASWSWWIFRCVSKLCRGLEAVIQSRAPFRFISPLWVFASLSHQCPCSFVSH